MKNIIIDGVTFRSRSAYAKHLINEGERDAKVIAENAGVKVPLVYYLFYSMGIMEKDARPVNKTRAKKATKVVVNNLGKIMSVTTFHNGVSKTMTVRTNRVPTSAGRVSAVEFNKSKKYHILDLNYVKQIKVDGEVYSF